MAPFLLYSMYEQQRLQHHLRHPGYLFPADQLALQPFADPADHPLDLLAHLPGVRTADRPPLPRPVENDSYVLFQMISKL